MHCPAVSWQTPPIPSIKKVFAEAFWNRSVQCSTKELTDKWLEATSHSAQCFFFFLFFGCSCSFITSFTYVTQVTHITTFSLVTPSVFLNRRPMLVQPGLPSSTYPYDLFALHSALSHPLLCGCDNHQSARSLHPTTTINMGHILLLSFSTLMILPLMRTGSKSLFLCVFVCKHCFCVCMLWLGWCLTAKCKMSFALLDTNDI